MPVIKDKEKTIELNADGFMLHPDEWTDQIAKILAKDQEGIDNLTEEHWTVIRYLRGYFKENGQAPTVRKLCASSGVSLKRIFELFPSGPAKGACKLAGLPKPDSCV